MSTAYWLVLVLTETEALHGNGMAQFATERVAISKPLVSSSTILRRFRTGSLISGDPIELVELVSAIVWIAERLVGLKDGNGRSSFFIGVDPVLTLTFVKRTRTSDQLVIRCRNAVLSRYSPFVFSCTFQYLEDVYSTPP